MRAPSKFLLYIYFYFLITIKCHRLIFKYIWVLQWHRVKKREFDSMSPFKFKFTILKFIICITIISHETFYIRKLLFHHSQFFFCLPHLKKKIWQFCQIDCMNYQKYIYLNTHSYFGPRGYSLAGGPLENLWNSLLLFFGLKIYIVLVVSLLSV